MWQKMVILTAVVGMAVAMGGCKSKQDKLTEEALDVHEEMLEVLKGIKDKASLEAGLEKIKPLARKYHDLLKQRLELKKTLSDAEWKALSDKYRSRSDALYEQRKAEVNRITKQAKDPVGALKLVATMSGMT